MIVRHTERRERDIEGSKERVVEKTRKNARKNKKEEYRMTRK